MRFYISMTKSKFSASFIVVPSIFVIHLINSTQYFNVTCVTPATLIAISPFTKM